jgi:hypothetical protein
VATLTRPYASLNKSDIGIEDPSNPDLTSVDFYGGPYADALKIMQMHLNFSCEERDLTI